MSRPPAPPADLGGAGAAFTFGIVAIHLATAAAHHGCALTSAMVRRLAGSTHSSLVIRSRASAETGRHRSSGVNVNLPLTTWRSSLSMSLARNGIVFESIT